MIEVFKPFATLYGPDAHPRYPWWRKDVQPQGNIARWSRGDATWEVVVDTHMLGEITVKRRDLDEWNNPVEVQQLRAARGRHPSPVAVGAAAGTTRDAIIERIPLSNQRFASSPGVNPVDVSSYSRTAPKERMSPQELSAFVDAILLRLDHDLPRPRPPLWAGQCWADDRGAEHFIVGRDEHGLYRLGGGGAVTSEGQMVVRSHATDRWLVALLYGPTVIGHNRPWLNAKFIPNPSDGAP